MTLDLETGVVLSGTEVFFSQMVRVRPGRRAPSRVDRYPLILNSPLSSKNKPLTLSLSILRINLTPLEP